VSGLPERGANCQNVSAASTREDIAVVIEVDTTAAALIKSVLH
jgi:hypothetical protein